MKYSSTVRLINVVLFLMLSAGFIFLGVWSGLVVSPSMIAQEGGMGVSYALFMELGVLGLAAGLVSLVGLLFSILSNFKSDDRLVVRSFSCYVALGFVLAIFAFLNAIWLYRLTSSNFSPSVNTGFVITVFAIVGVVITIATCIPFVRLFQEERTQAKSLKILSGVLLAVDLSLLLVQGLGYLVTKGQANFNAEAKNIYVSKLAYLSLIAIVCTVVSCLAYLLANRADKKASSDRPASFGYIAALGLNGFAIVFAGLLGIYWYNGSSALKGPTNSLLGQKITTTLSVNYDHWREFAITGYVLGVIVLFVACIFLFYTLFPSRVKKVSEER